MKLTQQQVNELSDAIIGTTNGIAYGLDAIGIPDPDNAKNQLDAETLVMLDERFFVCDVCGWTCDIDEMIEGDGQVCNECEEYNEDPDDE